MSLLVVDASVAAKWILPPVRETLTEEAVQLLGRYEQGQLRFIVPDFFWAELANVLWKAVRQGRLSKAGAAVGLAEMKDRNLPTVPSVSLLDEAFRIATAYDRSVYDSLYVALALISKGQLITADAKLANALAAHLPVKLLGST